MAGIRISIVNAKYALVVLVGVVVCAVSIAAWRALEGMSAPYNLGTIRNSIDENLAVSITCVDCPNPDTEIRQLRSGEGVVRTFWTRNKYRVEGRNELFCHEFQGGEVQVSDPVSIIRDDRGCPAPGP